MRYGDLTRTHPAYEPDYWRELRALYKGGESLLRDRATMARLFPRNGAEADDVYNERLARAVYINYAGTLVDYIVASLAGEPITLAAEPPADPFFDEFQRSVDGRTLTLAGLLRTQILTALQCRRAWTLVDLPPRDDGAVIESAQDEEDVGALRAFALPIDPESVLDWDESPSGDLEWALVCMRSQSRADLTKDRSLITEQYTHYTRTAWQRYEVSYKAGKPPSAKSEVPLVASGTHSFGRVPLARLELPEGLWAMNKLHCLAREHLNKRSSTSWSQYRHLFPILGAYLAPEISADGMPAAGENASDPGRATNQVYGIGRMVVFGKDDALKYTSPDTAIYESALRDLDSLRDEMHRVVHQMALAANNSSAAIGRSGDSKAQDRATATVVLVALGEIVREHGVEICDLASRGRRDLPVRRWTAMGMQEFDETSLADVVAEATSVDKLEMPSPTFQALRQYDQARRLLRGVASPEQLATIRKELEDAATKPPPAPPVMVPPVAPDGDEPADTTDPQR